MDKIETMRFKTSLKCEGCVTKVTEPLNQLVGEGNWAVDLSSPERQLKIYSGNVTEGQIVEAMKGAGYTAERIA